MTTIDFDTCVCSHLSLRQTNIVELTYLQRMKPSRWLDLSPSFEQIAFANPCKLYMRCSNVIKLRMKRRRNVWDAFHMRRKEKAEICTSWWEVYSQTVYFDWWIIQHTAVCKHTQSLRRYSAATLTKIRRTIKQDRTAKKHLSLLNVHTFLYVAINN